MKHTLTAAAVAIATSCIGLAEGGIAGPVELDAAELARCVNSGILDGHNLPASLASTETPSCNTSTTLRLSTVLAALGFRAFGVSAWAGRLPLALYGALGLVALFLLVAHLSHARAGLASVLVAASAPLYYVQARSLAGQAAGMSSLAIAVAGLGVAALGPASRRMRLGALALGTAGLGLGLLAHGVALGIVIPAASVGLTWALTHRASQRCSWIVLAAAASALAAGVAVIAFSETGFAGASLRLGAAALGAPGVRASFDVVLAELGHGLFPWSALLPFALASMTERPAGATSAEDSLRVLLLIGTALSYGAGALSVHVSGQEPFAGLVFVAGAVGLWLWDLDRGSRVSRPVLASLALLVALLALDFVREPDTSARLFAPGATPAQLGALRLPGSTARTPFLICLGLTLAGAFMAGTHPARAVPFRERWQSTWLFGGTLLAALLLRYGHYPALTAALPENPLDELLFEHLPRESTPLDVDIGGRVQVLGWDVVDGAGQPIETAPSRAEFRLRVYYEVTAGDVSGHCTFLHIDHRPTRFALEHTEWKQYPLALWRSGDRILDTFDVSLPLHFVAGDYPVYFGFGVLPCQDDRRLPVSRGAHDQHRVLGGILRVR